MRGAPGVREEEEKRPMKRKKKEKKPLAPRVGGLQVLSAGLARHTLMQHTRPIKKPVSAAVPSAPQSPPVKAEPNLCSHTHLQD
ncbi:hypothetical protein EYF80_019296 [Liparis tanakae]|uniref:Uncharacterized protein n=1 Tax=Liparis tanakae TaxID=230148 RepID=A0A4Z2HX57_9TELE|nr:hypothetical protein EYF80_019296 [Liparis tanakae]